MSLRGVFRLVDLGLAALQAVVATYDRARRIGRRLLPRKREDAFPLTAKDVRHQQEQIRRATEQGARCHCGAWHYRKSTNDCFDCEQSRRTEMQLAAQGKSPPHPRG